MGGGTVGGAGPVRVHWPQPCDVNPKSPARMIAVGVAFVVVVPRTTSGKVPATVFPWNPLTTDQVQVLPVGVLPT